MVEATNLIRSQSSSNLGLPTGSNLVVIKTQGVLKGFTEDHYHSYFGQIIIKFQFITVATLS